MPKPSLFRNTQIDLIMSSVIKIYKIKANEAVLPLSLGKCKVTAHFKGGNLLGGRWATLTTADPIVQMAIEKSPRFGSVILLERVVVSEPEKEESAAATEAKVVEGPTTINDVIAYLKDVEGVEMSAMKTMAAVKKVIARLNLSFPNVNLA